MATIGQFLERTSGVHDATELIIEDQDGTTYEVDSIEPRDGRIVLTMGEIEEDDEEGDEE